MKKNLLLVITLVVLGIGSASAQTVWGGRIGLSKPTVFSSDGDNLAGKFGLELGPVLYYSLKNNWYINSGAMFSIKTFEYWGNALSMYYLDIPLYAGYSFPVGNLSLYAQTGPFMGIRLGATTDMEDMSSFNAGLGFMAGINLNRFKVELGYQAGLTNLYSDGDYSEKLSSLFLGVSYIF